MVKAHVSDFTSVLFGICLEVIVLSINDVRGAPLVPESSDEFCERSAETPWKLLSSTARLCSAEASYGCGFLYSISLMAFRW